MPQVSTPALLASGLDGWSHLVADPALPSQSSLGRFDNARGVFCQQVASAAVRVALTGSSRLSGELGRLVDWMATVNKKMAQAVVVEPSSSRKLAKDYCFSGIQNEQAVSPVLGLLTISGPAAVAWLIVAIVVDAFNRMFGRRTRTHVAVEVQEIIGPSLAYTDTPESVVLVPLGRMTPGLHASPLLVLDTKVAARGVAMSSCAFGRKFTGQAAAASRITCHKVNGRYDSACAALAPAKPCRQIPTDVWRATYDGKPSINFSSSVDQSHGHILPHVQRDWCAQ